MVVKNPSLIPRRVQMMVIQVAKENEKTGKEERKKTERKAKQKPPRS